MDGLFSFNDDAEVIDCKNNTNQFSEFLLFPNGGASGLMRQQLLTLHILYFYLNFPHRCFFQAHQVCFANLRTLLSCAHLYGWALPVPPCERIFSTIYFGIVARHDTVVLRSFPRISPKISLSRAHNLYNIVCFSSFYFFKIYMEKIKFTKIFHI